MGRQPCCDKIGLKKGPWTAEEDNKLINFILSSGQCCWRAVPKLAGLLRCGKSCRLRWTNYLRPDLKRGLLSEYEEKMVIDLHSQLGNRWSKIASHLSGRTDNEIKNHWNTHIKKKLRKMGIDPLNHKPLPTIDSNNKPQEQEEHPSLSCDILENRQSEEKETSMESPSIIEEAKEEADQKNMESEVNNEFCIDEVPLIEPHEILVPCASSSSSSSSCGTIGMLEDYNMELQSFEWQNNMGFWDDGDEYFKSLDLLINGDSDSNLTVDLEYPRMILDQESRKFELL